MTRTVLTRSFYAALMAVLLLAGFRPALAAPAHQEVAPGVYYSEPTTIGDDLEVEFTLFLGSDSSAVFVTSTTDGSDSLTEYGTWEQPKPGLVGVTLTGDDEGDYDTPDLIIFEQDGDTLHALEFDTDFFGEEPWSVTLAFSEDELMNVEGDAEIAAVGGVYASDALTSPDGALGVALLHLAADGTAQGNINYFDGVTPPDVQLGTWGDNGDGTITLRLDTILAVTADGAEPAAMDAPVERTYTVGASGELVGENLTLYPLASGKLGGDQGETVLYVSDLLPSADTPGRVISLAVAADGGAALATDYLNGEDPVLETGNWTDNDDETVTITLTASGGETYAEPVVITFAVDGETLTAVDADATLYGDAGLVLTRVMEESNAPATAPAEDVASFSFSSDVLPSADTPGLVITFTFYEDGRFTAASDYKNDKAPIVEYGTWEEADDNNARVTVTGDDNGDYDEPLVFTVEAVDEDGGTIRAVNADVFGADGLTLRLVQE